MKLSVIVKYIFTVCPSNINFSDYLLCLWGPATLLGPLGKRGPQIVPNGQDFFQPLVLHLTAAASSAASKLSIKKARADTKRVVAFAMTKNQLMFGGDIKD